MIAGKTVLAFVMAGGEGTRLHSLTADRCKPSVPFNGKHRIVDFVLSNLINSEIYSVYLLVQYKSQSLIEHIRQSWAMSRITPNQFITVVPPQMRYGPEWFQGTADAVYQNIHLIENVRPDLVAVFGADHIYRWASFRSCRWPRHPAARSKSTSPSRTAFTPSPGASMGALAVTATCPFTCWPSTMITVPSTSFIAPPMPAWSPACTTV